MPPRACRARTVFWKLISNDCAQTCYLQVSIVDIYSCHLDRQPAHTVGDPESGPCWSSAAQHALNISPQGRVVLFQLECYLIIFASNEDIRRYTRQVVWESTGGPGSPEVRLEGLHYQREIHSLAGRAWQVLAKTSKTNSQEDRGIISTYIRGGIENLTSVAESRSRCHRLEA
ncbi:hypothetical protein BDV12DRAFT_110839 [Aspergillus spectabilis]